MELSQKISNGRGLVEHQFLFNKTTLFCVSPISDVGLEKLLSLAVKEDLIARNGKFVGYGFSRCEPKQEQVSTPLLFLKLNTSSFLLLSKIVNSHIHTHTSKYNVVLGYNIHEWVFCYFLWHILKKVFIKQYTEVPRLT